MESLAVDLLLLRSLEAHELRIAPGRALMARVVRADGSGRGALSIAGVVIDAELPKHVRGGQELRPTLGAVDLQFRLDAGSALGAEIPEALYVAVAETLAWAYRVDAASSPTRPR